MTIDETQLRKQAVDAIIKGVAKKTALIVSVASAGAVVFSVIQKTAQPWWFLPVSVLFGGVLGLLNFRWRVLFSGCICARVRRRRVRHRGGDHQLLKLSLIFISLSS
jgi:hypothetical protein